MSGIEQLKLKILNRVSLSSLLSEYMKLDSKAGRLYGLCPFHKEKTPSFTVFDDKRYYCFGCKANGDTIEFVKQKHNLSFIEALKFIAEKYGIPAPELSRPNAFNAQHTKSAQYFEIVAKAQKFFRQGLQNPNDRAAVKAKQYLNGRGFSDEFIEQMEFGLSPTAGNQLLEYLARQKYALADIKQVGLIGQSSRTKRFFDFFRSRIMIPIKDSHGRVIAFGGRTIIDDPRKYLNSSNTVLFQKGYNLFGLDFTKKAIQEKRSAIIVEGYMDALQLWNHGIFNCVACLGTALTKNQIQLLKPYCSEIILAFDGDRAGRQAAFDTLKHAIDFSQIAFHSLHFEEGNDPDSFVREHGAEAVHKLIRNKVSLFDYSIAFLFKNASKHQYPDIVSKQILPWLAQLNDPIRQDFIVSQIALQTGLSKSQLLNSSKKIERERQSEPNLDKGLSGEVDGNTPSPPAKLTALNQTAAEVFGIVYFARPGELDCQEVLEFLKKNFSLHPLWMNLAQEFLDDLSSSKGQSPWEKPVIAWSSSGHSEILKFIERLQSMRAAYSKSLSNEALQQIFFQIEKNNIQEKIDFLKNRISIDGSLSPELIPEYLTEIKELSKRQDNLRQQYIS